MRYILDEVKIAEKSLAKMKEFPCFSAGRRNTDAVNLCIFCAILGLDAMEIFKVQFEESKWGHFHTEPDVWDFRDRQGVIEDYLDSWSSDYLGYAFLGEPYVETVIVPIAQEEFIIPCGVKKV